MAPPSINNKIIRANGSGFDVEVPAENTVLAGNAKAENYWELATQYQARFPNDSKNIHSSL